MSRRIGCLPPFAALGVLICMLARVGHAAADEPVVADEHGCWPGQAFEGGRCQGAPIACPSGFEGGDEMCRHRMSGDGPWIFPGNRIGGPPCDPSTTEYLGSCYTTLGALDKSEIDAVIKHNMGAVKECYQRSLTADPTQAGKVTVKFVIAKDGTVSSATTKATTLAAPLTEACINREFMSFQFEEPRGGGIVIVSYPFVFSPYALPDSPIVGVGLKREQVRAVVHRHRKVLDACYHSNSELTSATGEVGVRFTVAVTGAVGGVRINSARSADDAFDRCIQSAFEAMTFPIPSAGDPVAVYYPLPGPRVGT